MFLRPACTLALLLALGGCQSQPQHASGHDSHVSHTDWDKATIVRVELRDYGFDPREIRLRSGQPYRLEFFNSGGNTHYFNAPEFFRAIAAHKAEVPDHAEVKAERYTQFEIMRRGGKLHFYFIPLVAGTYPFHCHLENHAQLGVEGVIVVE